MTLARTVNKNDFSGADADALVLKSDHTLTLHGPGAGNLTPLAEQLTTALAAAQVGEWDVDLETDEAALSAWSRHLIGLPQTGRVTLADIQARRHPDDREPADALHRALHADPPTGFIRQSLRFQLADGATRWLELRGTIFRDRNGRPVRVLGMMIDVTDREERAQVLEQNWRRFQAALANTAIIVFEQDMDLRYTWIHNPPLGYEAYRLVGKTDIEVMGPALGGLLEAKKRRVLESGRALQTEVTVPGSAGDDLYDLHIEPMRNDQGAIVGVACAAIALGPAVAGVAGKPPHRPVTPPKTVVDRDLLLDRISARVDSRKLDRGLIPICTSVLARKLGRFATLSGNDRALLATLEAQSRYVAGKDLLDLSAGDGGSTWLIGNGWVYSYVLLADGRRQIIGFHLPGDLISRGGQQTTGDHHLYATAGDCVLCSLDQAALDDILRGQTCLAEALRWTAARDVAIIEQHLVSIGRRSGAARLAHLLLELGARLEAVELADPGGYRCPLTQELLADALGLTSVHVNRQLRWLRDQGLLSFVRGFVAFTDKARLIDLADYNPTYLDRPPIERTARPVTR